MLTIESDVAVNTRIEDENGSTWKENKLAEYNLIEKELKQYSNIKIPSTVCNLPVYKKITKTKLIIQHMKVMDDLWEAEQKKIPTKLLCN